MNLHRSYQRIVRRVTLAALAIIPSLCVSAPLRENFLKDYCIKCHGAEKQKGDRRFDSLSTTIKSPDDALLWQEILDQLNKGEMPPKKEKQPQTAELLAAVDAITESVGEAALRFKGTAAHTVLRRINSYEYRITLPKHPINLGIMS